MATAGRDPTVRIWNTTTAQEIQRLSHEDEVNAVAFSPNGQYLATASRDKMARVWAWTNGREVGRISHNDEVKESRSVQMGKPWLPRAGMGPCRCGKWPTGVSLHTGRIREG
jgi:WD40 repeat protein